jgi:flagellar hook assembly protein FlgD
VHLEDARLLLTPSDFVLYHNYPNPFNPATTIRYAIPQAERVTLRVYNILGQQVASLVDGRQEAGFYAAQWDGKDARGRGVASGIYFYRIQAGKFVRTEKMLLLK